MSRQKRDSMSDELRRLLREAEECIASRPDTAGIEASVWVQPDGIQSDPLELRWGKVGAAWRLTIGGMAVHDAGRAWAIAAALHLPALRNALVGVARKVDEDLARAVATAQAYVLEERAPESRSGGAP